MGNTYSYLLLRDDNASAFPPDCDSSMTRRRYCFECIFCACKSYNEDDAKSRESIPTWYNRPSGEKIVRYLQDNTQKTTAKCEESCIAIARALGGWKEIMRGKVRTKQTLSPTLPDPVRNRTPRLGKNARKRNRRVGTRVRTDNVFVNDGSSMSMETLSEGRARLSSSTAIWKSARSRETIPYRTRVSAPLATTSSRLFSSNSPDCE
jgi:hypothetical protein